MLALVLALSITAPPAIAIRNVGIVQPGVEAVIADQTVIVEGDKIVSVGPSAKAVVPAGAKVVDGTGKYLMPGLWDMHVHLMSNKELPLFTANGVTGIRVMFGSPSQLLWRKQAETGEIVCPHMVVGSPIVDGPIPVWAGSIAIATEDEARAAVRKIKKDGYDFIKVYSLIPRVAYFALAAESKKAGIPFEGHVPYAVGILEAAKAGQRSAEHVLTMSIDSSSREEEFHGIFDEAAPKGIQGTFALYGKIGKGISESFDAKKFEGVIRELARYKMAQCPTLVVLKTTAFMDQTPDKPDPRLKYVNIFVSASWDPKKDFRFKDRTTEDWARAKRLFAGTQKTVALMYKAGVPILTGTDCFNPNVFPGFSVHEELALLVEAGLTPSQALTTATVTPAHYYNQDKITGTIEKGKRADMVLLSANPLRDIHNTTSILAVVQRGKLFDRSGLDGLLKSAEFSPPR